VGVVVSDPARSLYAALSGQTPLIELIVASPFGRAQGRATCDLFVVPAHRWLALQWPSSAFQEIVPNV